MCLATRPAGDGLGYEALGALTDPRGASPEALQDARTRRKPEGWHVIGVSQVQSAGAEYGAQAGNSWRQHGFEGRISPHDRGCLGVADRRTGHGDGGDYEATAIFRRSAQPEEHRHKQGERVSDTHGRTQAAYRGHIVWLF